MQALRSAPHRALAILVVVAVAIAMTIYVNRAEAVITTPFGQEFGTNANGAILMRGNANLVCPAAATGCTAGQSGSGSTTDESLNNNGYIMENVGGNGADLVNSSTATIAMPAHSSVLFAGLYWSANTAAGNSGAPAPTPADKNKVRFAVPGTAGWSTVTATKTFTDSSITAYQMMADVTSVVAGAGNGIYGVANIQAGTGKDRYAGWSLVIAYQNASLPMRDLRVFDGFGVVSSNATSVDIAVNGFLTPGTGQVTTKIGTVVYEGDLGKTGDTLKLNGTSMYDDRNPVDNFFNSTITEGGVAVGDRTPNNSNTMGLDIDQFDATGKLANGASSATLTLTTATGGETFYPGVVTFTTDLYAPDLTATLAAADKTRDPADPRLMPGDEIEYTITVLNKGTDSSKATVLADAVPAGTTYVPGSLRIDGVAVTDASGDDAGDFVPDSADGKATFRIGTGATATTGGNLATNGTSVVKYRVKVDDTTAAGTTITNIGTLSYTGEHTGRVIAGTTNVVTATVEQPRADLSAAVTVSPGTVQRDDNPAPVTYNLTVTNNGTDREPLAVARLTLPAGVTPDPLPAGCTQVDQDVICSLGAIVSGASTTVTITALADKTAATDSTGTVTVSGSGIDNTPANNSAPAPLRVNSAPTAGADSADIATNGTATVAVLSNDSDADNDTLSVALASPPAHGSALVNADKTITYTPAAGWAGTDTFTYTVSDGHGGATTATITVNVDNALPIAGDDVATTGPNQAVPIFVLDNDSDPNGDPLSVSAVTQPAGGMVTTDGTTVTFTPGPAFRGLATFSYTLSDSRGGTATGRVEVTVDNAAPAANDDVITTPYHTDVDIDVVHNDTDPNKDDLTVKTVGTPSHGTATIVDNKITYRPEVGFSGDDTFSYTISDGAGGTSTAQVTVTVGNAAPTAENFVISTGYGTAAVIDVLSTAKDANHDTLTVAGTSVPAHGMVGVNDKTGKLEYVPDEFYSGPDSFTYDVVDGHGGLVTARVDVTVANGVPVAAADSVTAEAKVPLIVPVLANDVDPNNDKLTVTIDQAPQHGTAVVNADGTVTYTPATGYLGPDAFHYTVDDGHGGTDGADVTIAVINSAPVAKPDAITSPTDIPVTITVLDNDSDPNGDAITVTGFTNGGHGTVTLSGGNLVYAPVRGFTGTDSFTYTISDPSHATATSVVTVTVLNANPIAVPDTATAQPGKPTVIKVLTNDTDPNLGQALHLVTVGTPKHGTAVANPDGTITYTPNADATGTDTFDYVVGDDKGGQDTTGVTVTIAPLPVAAPDQSSTPAGAPVVLDVLANDSKTATLVSVSQPKHGTVKIVDGKVQYTPEPGYAGTDTFTYLVRDAAGNESTGQASVTVANADPVAVLDRGAVAKNGSTDIDVLANDTDVNTGQKLTISTVGKPAHGTATIVDGKVRYVPDPGWTGTDTFTYVVSDGNGGTATGTVSVVVTGDAPVALPDRKDTPYQRAVTVDVLANDMDPNGDRLTVVGVTQPEHGTATIVDGKVQYTPPAKWSGTVSFTYTISDGTDKATSTVTVKVGEPPAVPDKATTAKPATPVTIALPRVDNNQKPVTVTSVGKPAHGTAELNADGTVTYTPEAGFAGADSFTYAATDADGNIAYGTIKVTVAGPNTAPRAVNDVTDVDAGKSVVIDVRANDSDPNEDPITVVKVGKPRHGHAVLNKNGTITYAPNDSYQGGTDSFTYTVSDGRGGTATATVTVVVNQVAAAPGTNTVVKLPKTGADIMSLGGVGILTLIVGAALFFFGGRTPAWIVAGGRDRGPGRHRPGKHAPKN
ncbi:Ig-like domain-containing protein [Actinoplanes sp. N902-109]|uniref:beta strand repeat-containing protein n=1 Tax=Actinoplanes sp. (strain N902-109) TaxID=649831 RepID=UPI0003295F97|nr:Ig-like domain-containing protein [Actinoplanes sp. N902-109]AGL21292.1 outer membrane adhesin-like protein [Actinoplanes sp. N902-109]